MGCGTKNREECNSLPSSAAKNKVKRRRKVGWLVGGMNRGLQELFVPKRKDLLIGEWIERVHHFHDKDCMKRVLMLESWAIGTT